jgi:SRSO17 transposase
VTFESRFGWLADGSTQVRLAKKHAALLSVATATVSLPIAWRLYLPEVWATDEQRREEAGVPEEIGFQTKPQIALEQIQEAVAQGIARGVVLADPGYGNDSAFRAGVTELGFEYLLGVSWSISVWKPGQQPLPAQRWKGRGRPARRLRRDERHQPVSAKQLAMELPSSAWKDVSWREGSQQTLSSRFAALRVRPAHRDYLKTEPHAEEWLLIEWPRGEAEPTKYWLSTLPEGTKLKPLVRIAKHRWVIERDYQELKQELGLGHYEGGNWRGFHHHGALSIAAYGFLVAERSRFYPSARVGHLGLPTAALPAGFRPRGSGAPRAA